MGNTSKNVQPELFTKTVRKDLGPGHLPVLSIANDYAECTVFLYGAHVASFKPRGAADVLFISPHSLFVEGKPIRGGIPICFPWFGKHSGWEDLFLHGLVRTQMWKLQEATDEADGSTALVLRTCDDEYTRSVWPYRFSLQLTISIAQTLKLVLQVTNADTQAFTFEEGFHTYLSIGSLRECSVSNLDGCTAVDCADSNREYVQTGPVTVSGEFVRIFSGIGPVVTLQDAALRRSIHMEQQNLKQVCIWNPGEVRALENPEVMEVWDTYLCVEHVNCHDGALLLEPGGTHESSIVFSVHPCDENK